MFIVNNKRNELLDILPSNSICAEIGVARGFYSQEILNRVVPKKLHLIDPWEFQDDEEYKADSNNLPDQEQETRFKNIQNKFEKEIQNGIIEIHREYSYKAAPSFADSYFDWVYVDAAHMYQEVRRDLEAFYPKVKDGGFILGHDFTNRIGPVRRNFGVVDAVINFLKYFPCEFLAVTNQSNPTFLLVKKPYADYKMYTHAQQFIEHNFKILFEVGGDHIKDLKHKELGKRPSSKYFWSIG